MITPGYYSQYTSITIEKPVPDFIHSTLCKPATQVGMLYVIPTAYHPLYTLVTSIIYCPIHSQLTVQNCDMPHSSHRRSCCHLSILITTQLHPTLSCLSISSLKTAVPARNNYSNTHHLLQQSRADQQSHHITASWP